MDLKNLNQFTGYDSPPEADAPRAQNQELMDSESIVLPLDDLPVQSPVMAGQQTALS